MDYIQGETLQENEIAVSLQSCLVPVADLAVNSLQ
jgi:hypothetical protein